MPTGNSNEILKARVVTVSGDTAEVITEGDFRRGKTPGGSGDGGEPDILGVSQNWNPEIHIIDSPKKLRSVGNLGLLYPTYIGCKLVSNPTF